MADWNFLLWNLEWASMKSISTALIIIVKMSEPILELKAEIRRMQANYSSINEKYLFLESQLNRLLQDKENNSKQANNVSPLSPAELSTGAMKRISDNLIRNYEKIEDHINGRCELQSKELHQVKQYVQESQLALENSISSIRNETNVVKLNLAALQDWSASEREKQTTIISLKELCETKVNDFREQLQAEMQTLRHSLDCRADSQNVLVRLEKEVSELKSSQLEMATELKEVAEEMQSLNSGNVSFQDNRYAPLPSVGQSLSIQKQNQQKTKAPLEPENLYQH